MLVFVLQIIVGKCENREQTWTLHRFQEDGKNSTPECIQTGLNQSQRSQFAMITIRFWTEEHGRSQCLCSYGCQFWERTRGNVDKMWIPSLYSFPCTRKSSSTDTDSCPEKDSARSPKAIQHSWTTVESRSRTAARNSAIPEGIIGGLEHCGGTISAHSLLTKSKNLWTCWNSRICKEGWEFNRWRTSTPVVWDM